MTNRSLPSVEQLISEFEKGHSIQSQLDLINEEDSEEIREWLDRNEIWWPFDDYIEVVDEGDIFFIDEKWDDITEYYELDFLLGLDNQGILKFIQERLDSCLVREDTPLITFYQYSDNSVISARAELHGQAGYYPYNILIATNHQQVVEEIIDRGYMFKTDERFTYLEELALTKYRELVLNRIK